MQPKKLSILFTFYPYAGNSSGSSLMWEVADWFNELSVRLKTEEKFTSRIEKTAVKSYADTPITMTRNRAVRDAQENGFDIIVMVDSDMTPDMYHDAPRWFDVAFDELYDHYDKGPLVLGAPYGGKPPHENMFVFKWAGYMNCENETPFSLEQYTREEAALATGTQECAALPTGLIMYDMRAFDLIERPYFRYEWTDSHQSDKASTEDVQNTRDIAMHGINDLGYNPLRCTWDCWAGHNKVWTVGKPALLTAENVHVQLQNAVLRGHKDKTEKEIEVDLSLPKVTDHKTPEDHVKGILRMIDSFDGTHLTVAEVGAWTGETTRRIADHPKVSRVIAVDNFKGCESDYTSELASHRDIKSEHMQRRDGCLWWDVIEGDSVAAADRFEALSLDLVIIDADHSYESTLNDIKAWWPKVGPNGVIMGHDYNTVQFPGVADAVDRFFKSGAKPLCWSKEHGGFWVVDKSSPFEVR